jgi:hypothetical protein
MIAISLQFVRMLRDCFKSPQRLQVPRHPDALVLSSGGL